MGVRLIAGRAGSGKTHWCLTRIRDALAAGLTEGPRLILLVPEQAALQMERALLAMAPVPALGRCEVLSFRRLAHRILQSGGAGSRVVMTPLGRRMALRHLIGRHRKSLREFAGVSERGGFVAAISRAVTELLQESVTIDQLESAAAGAEANNDPSAPRLHDVAVLYRAYLEYLTSQRVDPEGVLDLARSRLDDVAWLRGAVVFFDGFAGMTQQQVRMTVALAERAAEVNVSLLLDPASRFVTAPDAEPDDLSLFAHTERTWSALSRAFRSAGLATEAPVLLGAAGHPRFQRAGGLEHLERRLFRLSGPFGAAADAARLTGPDQQPAARTHDTAAGSGIGRGTIRLVRSPDPRCEVEAAIRTIVDLVHHPDHPMRFRDIALVVRDLEPYHDLISGCLRAHGIPFFIDRRRPTFHHPLVELVRAALAMHGSGSFGAAIAMLLKTGLSGLDDQTADALENYQLAHGLTTPASWSEEWSHPARPGRRAVGTAVAEQDELSGIITARDSLLQRIGPWWPDAGRTRGRPSCRTWVERLGGLLGRLEVTTRLAGWCDEASSRGDLDEAAEHEHVWSDLLKLLEELTAVLGDERMTGRQFQEVVETALAEFTLGLVPATLDQVLVGSIERSRHPAVRAMFVLGFGDGQFPARVPEEIVLTDDERQCLATAGVTLGRTRSSRLLDERMLAYVALTRPSEFLWVSYPERGASGAPSSPSPYWPWLRAAVPDIEVEHIGEAGPETVSNAATLAGGLARGMRRWCEGAIDEAESAPWLALYDWASGQERLRAAVGRALSALAESPPAVLSAGAIASLWRAPFHTSVTRLEQFAGCPFQHFAARGLRLEPRPEHEISALDMGRLYHTVLEQFVNELMETGRSLSDMTPGDIARNLSRLSELAVPSLSQEARVDERQQRWARRRTGRDLPPAVEGARRSIGRSPLRPLLTERVFGGDGADDLPALLLKTPEGIEVSVHGKIDRVDLLRAEDVSLAVVYDYKRSVGRRLRLDEVYHGLALQLLAYLLVIADHGRHISGTTLRPGGAFYLPLLAGFARVGHPAEAVEDDAAGFKSFRPRGVVDFDWIDRLDPDGAAAGGWSPVFSVYRTRDGGLGHVDRGDAVEGGALPMLLSHVRRTMGTLAGRWIDGDISVLPSRLGDQVPCAYCKYQSVCRMEYATRQTRRLSPMSRGDVLSRIATEARADG